MNVDTLYELLKFAVAKNTQQGYLSPADFNLVINQAQRSYLDYLRGEYQRYQIKRPIAVVEFGQNQMVRETLAPLIYGATLDPNSSTGIASFPADYEFADAMWDVYTLYNIRFIQQDRQDAYIHSRIDPIATNPVYLIQHEGFEFFPRDIGHARLSYVRTPPTIVWGYATDANGIPIYDPTTSVDPVWGETDIWQIAVRGLHLVGVNLQLNTVIQYSNDIKQGGQ